MPGRPIRWTEGWQAFSGSPYLNDPVQHVTVRHNIPGPPSFFEWQTLYYFLFTAEQTNRTLLQPVLQYGPSPAGGGQYWSLASWFLFNGVLYYSALVPVPDGVVELVGHIERVAPGSFKVWYEGYPETEISVDGYPEQAGAGIACETYGFFSRRLDANASTDFVANVVTLDTTTQTQLAVTWNVNNLRSGATVTIANNNTPSPTMTIHCPTSPR